jgi:D-lactate dehydrogenase
MKIAFFEIRDWEVKILKKRLSKHKLLFYHGQLTKEHIKEISDCDIISVFIYSQINKEIILNLPKLKLIVTRSTGFDHIDYKYASSKSIRVCNVPFYGENTVAEHAFALILALSRKTHISYLKDMANDFSIDQLKGFDLKGKTLGVIGVGHIGKHVVRIARGFEMNVLGNDHHPDKNFQKELGFKYASLEEIYKKSDIITLHVPYFKENYHMINSKVLKMMKPTAIIINTARGELIDTDALLNALEKNKLAGAGLDVIEGEALIKEEKELIHNPSHKDKLRLIRDLDIIRNPKVVFTPHIAFYSQEALDRILNTAIEDIESFVKNKPINLIKNV